MSLRIQSLIVTAAAIGLTTINTAHAGGCGRPGGFSARIGGSSFTGRIMAGYSSATRQPSYHAPQFQTLPTHVYQPHPQFVHPTHSQPSYPQHMQSQHMQSQHLEYAGANHLTHGGFQSNGSLPPRQNVVPQHNMQAQQNMQPQQTGVPPQNMQPQQTAGPQQGVPSGQSGVPQNQGNFAQAGNQPSRVQQAPTQQAPQSSAALQRGNGGSALTSTNNGGSSELSALQMLSTLNGNDVPLPENNAEAVEVPEFTAAATQSTGGHVGNWSVALPGNQAISLMLNNDNTFNWTATKEGKSSSFQGQYRLEGERLTLVRSNDLQQMVGNWTGDGTNFTFKLDGATTSGLAFSRSN